MFGVAVTDYTDKVVGSVGYIIKLDISRLLYEKIKSVQAQVDDDDTPEGFESEVTLEVLFNYLNSTDAPDLAFNLASNTLIIFFKTSAFPYVSDTRFDLKGWRLPQAVDADADYVDIPARDIEYLLLLVKKLMYEAKGNTLPDTIQTRIDDLETQIEEES